MSEQIVLACTFSGCKAKMAPEKAKVPAVTAIRLAIGKPVTVDDLTGWILCGRHAHLIQKEAAKKGDGKTFSYVGTVTLLEKRQSERKAAQDYLLHLRAKTQMGKAMAEALAPTSAKEPSFTRQPQSS
ncbi:MAG: hypothetical protein HYT62_01910 [Candidatus Yanofskybacteria bacterium]|nr:hypothetical protein [Candidatus Yanofskybacteria bacterium]